MADEKHDKQEELKENLIAVLIVLVIAALAGWWIYAKISAPHVLPQQRVSIPLAGSPTIGAAEAPVTIVEFSDFECPFCGQFARDTFPAINKTYIANGTVLFVFKQFPLPSHPDAPLAAKASLCADEQEHFWEYHDALYAHQDALKEQDLTGYAQSLGLNMTRFGACMQRPAARVDQEVAMGRNAAVSGTPTFFINGRKVEGYMGPQEFSAEIEKELAARNG